MEQSVLINLMSELAELEEQRTQTRARLERSARRRRLRTEVLQEEAADAQEAAAAARRAAVSLHNTETAVKALEADLARRRVLLQSADQERQAAALRREISAMEVRLDELLEQACAMMTGEGGQAPAAAPAGGGTRDGEDDLFAAEIQRLQGIRDDLEQQIARLMGMVPPEVARHVQRLWGQGANAVVFVADGACGGCFGRLPPQQGIAVSQGKAVVRCPACARFIVHRPFST